MTRIGVVAATVVLAGGVAYGVSQIAPGGPRSDPGIVNQPSQPSDPSESEALDTSDWTTYTSDLYDLEVGHPPDWTVTPATRKWRLDTDGTDFLSPAHVAFRNPDGSPEGDVRVSVWTAPLDPKTREETFAYLEAWVEDYCEATENTPCTGIADRAVELCLETRDCHPGLLVPFKYDVQAFFSGGDYAQDAMTIVAVWRPESDASVVPYGGSQRLLEAFLSTMDVRPNTLGVVR